MNKKTMKSRMELMNDQLELVTGGIMNPRDYKSIKERIEKSSMTPDKKKRALAYLEGFNKCPSFEDTNFVIEFIQKRCGKF